MNHLRDGKVLFRQHIPRVISGEIKMMQQGILEFTGDGTVTLQSSESRRGFMCSCGTVVVPR